MNLLSVTEKSSSGSPKPSNPNGRFCALCLGWLSPAVTGRALDIGAGRQEPVSRRIPAFSRFPLLWICSVTLSQFSLTRQTPPLYSSCVTVQVFPPSPIHLSLAGINLTRCTRCGVARGGRASGLESCPLDSPVPPMLARPPVYTHIHISIHALCCIKSSIHLKLIGFYIIHVAVCDRRLLIHRRDHKHVKGKLL